MDLLLEEQYGAEAFGNEHRTFAAQIKLREIVPQRRPAVHWPRATGQVLLRAPVVREEHERAVGQFEQQAREALDLRAPILSLQLLLDLARINGRNGGGEAGGDGRRCSRDTHRQRAAEGRAT